MPPLRLILPAVFFAFGGIISLRALVDTNHDGISDVWAARYPAAGGPAADPDGDGATNLAESIAGTNPRDSSDRLAAFVSVDAGTIYSTSSQGDITLRWRGLSNKRYTVKASTNLHNWGTINQVVGLDRECNVTVKARYVPPQNTSIPDPVPVKFYQVIAFDHDSNGNGVTDWEESHRLPATDPFAGARTTLTSPLIPFALCFANANWRITPSEQITITIKAGYNGLVLSSYDFDASRIKQFADHPDVASRRFRIPGILWWATTGADPKADLSGILDPILDQAVRMDMALWVVIDDIVPADKPADYKSNSPENVARAVTRLHVIADRCLAKGARLVLYPHADTTFVDTEEALVIYNQLAALGHPEVRLSIHLCHEQAAGAMGRIAATARAAAPLLDLATINGSNGGNDIKPLDQGTYDPTPFLRALADAGYTGPMVLHTYALQDPRVDDHLVRSLIRWHQLVAP